MEYMWFMQSGGFNKYCRLYNWNTNKCFPPFTPDYCGFSNWDATFCHEAWKLSVDKIRTIIKYANRPLSEQQIACTLMVVLVPRLSEVVWIPIPCNESILDRGSVYCMGKPKNYYTKFDKNIVAPVDTWKYNATLTTCNESTYMSMLFYCDGFSECKNKFDESECSRNIPSPSDLCLIINKLNILFSKTICPFENATSLSTPMSYNNNHCIFIINKNGSIVPHSNGKHLISCENINCNRTHFKCPGFYCIPWQYVCNGKTECPGSIEEFHCHNRSCSGLFKCHSSSICLPQDDLCNEIIDCPFKDDEFYCQIMFPVCPTNCSCVGHRYIY